MTERSWLAVALLASFTAGWFGSTVRWSATQAQWVASRDAYEASALVARDSLKRLTVRADSLESVGAVLRDSAEIGHVTIRKVIQTVAEFVHDTVRIPAPCRPIVDSLAAVCQIGLARADNAVRQATGAFDLEHQAKATVIEALGLSERRRSVADSLLKAAPIGEKKLFGLLPFPTIGIGYGAMLQGGKVVTGPLAAVVIPIRIR